ncbi:unnamed protein product [Urochloa decumbens]|uniref:Uncharacterized protein n=1 Tax=Urochloa decumbens TaxID=240449 RepID=A0ABC9BKC5_9POAL
MAASQQPVDTTVSRCIPNAERGRHLFEVAGHTLHKSLGAGSYIQSAAFSVGGHDWCVVYYPDGESAEGSGDYTSVFLKRVGKTTTVTQVRATYGFRLLVPPLPDTMAPTAYPLPFPTVSRVTANFNGVNSCWGLKKFVQKSLLVGYLRDDCLVIECDVTVIIGEGADVAFKVGEEIFRAHKIVLGARSPVFKAELYGPLGDKDREYITIEDMQPAIFKALLHFMYRDSLPEVGNLGVDEREEMAKHMLVAAERYGVDRLKVVCEGLLERRLDVNNVAATLALADQYHCSRLRDSCIEFINSLSRTEDLQASQGCAHLKRECPDIIVEIWEKGTKSRKI